MCPYGRIRLPGVFGSPTLAFGSAYLSRVGDDTHVHAQEQPGPPKSLMLLSTHPTLFVDPGRPSEDSPYRPLCVGFPSVNTVAVCFILSNGAVSSFRKYGLPCGLRGSLCTLQQCRSAGWFQKFVSLLSRLVRVAGTPSLTPRFSVGNSSNRP